MNENPYSIIGSYAAEYRGFTQYYLLAGDIARLNRLRWDMERSMFTTLAAKHRSTPWAMRDRYKTVTDTPHGKRRCFEARTEREGRTALVARFGRIPQRRDKSAVLTDRVPTPRRAGKQLIQRLLTGACEICGDTDGITVHHIRRLADLDRPEHAGAPRWVNLMRAKRRKPLWSADAAMTRSIPRASTRRSRRRSLESRVRGKLACPVREGAAGKGPAETADTSPRGLPHAAPAHPAQNAALA